MLHKIAGKRHFCLKVGVLPHSTSTVPLPWNLCFVPLFLWVSLSMNTQKVTNNLYDILDGTKSPLNFEDDLYPETRDFFRFI